MLEILLTLVLDGLARFNTRHFNYREIPPIVLTRGGFRGFGKERKVNISYGVKMGLRCFTQVLCKFSY